jgi:hypothetical protein
MPGIFLVANSPVLWGVNYSLLASHTVKEQARRVLGMLAGKLYRFAPISD